MAIVAIEELARRAAEAAVSRSGIVHSLSAGPGEGLVPEHSSAEAREGLPARGHGPASVKHRFRAGDGRPRGPRRGSKRRKSPDDYMVEELFKLTGVRAGERTEKVPVLHGLTKVVVGKAAKGDMRALLYVLTRAAAAIPVELEEVREAELTETDKATLAAHEARIAARLSRSRTSREVADDDLS